MNRIEEAKLTIKKIAAYNETPLSNETLAHVNLRKDLIDTTESLIDIFEFKRFLKIFILTNALWFFQNIAYTGAIAFAAISTDNPYMILTINSFVDIAAAVGCSYASELFGRKRATIIPCILAGILYPISGFIDQDDQVILFLLVVMSARLMLTVGFDVQYLYAAEVYPTNIRSRAYSVRMSIGSLGNLLAPQVKIFSILTHAYYQFRLIFLTDLSDNFFCFPRMLKKVVALGAIHLAIPLVIFGIASLLASGIMIFLPESKGCELPKSLIDGELFGLEGEERSKLASRYQKSGNGGLNFGQWMEKETADIGMNEFDLKKVKSDSTISETSGV